MHRASPALIATIAIVASLLPPPSARAGRAHDDARLAATPTARYNARFDATWTATTHPLGYPGSAHWSALVGGSHDGTIEFWQPGQLASQGIKDMAERGLTAPLVAEVQAQIVAGHAGAAVVGGSIATGAGVATATFDLTQQFSRATLVTMIAPSPDWFVGVAGLPLFSGGEWVEQVRVPLYAYDAGTDSGAEYGSANFPTVPPQPIALNAAPAFANGAVLGYFTFTRTDAPIGLTVPAAGAAGLAGLAVAMALGAGASLRRRTTCRSRSGRRPRSDCRS